MESFFQISNSFSIFWPETEHFQKNSVVLVTIQNLPVLKTTGYPISFPPLSSRCGFLECRPLAGEYTAQKIMRS